MNNLLIKILVTAAILDLGLSLKDLDCHDRQCIAKLQKASLQVTKIDWKPISVFPEEAARLRKYSRKEKSGGQK